MTPTTDTAQPTSQHRFGSGATSRPSPPLWWSAAQLVALSIHLPLSVLTGSQSAIASKQSVLLIAGATSLISLALYTLLGLTALSKWKALSLVSVTVLTFWHWSGTAESGPLATVAIYLLIAAAAVKFAETYLLKVAFFVTSVVLACTLGLLAFMDSLSAPPQTVGVQNHVDSVEFVEEPDILLIVLDGYGRGDVIESVYGYDNRPFLDSLRKVGFDVAERSTANYSITHLSLPALLNMSYMHPEGAAIGNNDLNFLANQISGESTLISILKNNGYSYVHAESDTWYNLCGGEVDICLPGPNPDITGHALLTRTPIGGLFYRETADPTTALNRTRVNQLTHWDETIADWPDGPTFAFFHLQLPHPPLYMDSQCAVRVDTGLGGRIMNNGEMTPTQLDKRKRAWIEQVECANATIQTLLRSLDEDTVVVLVSDHGPDLNFTLERNPDDIDPDGIAERFPTLTAVRLPESCRGALPEDVSTVNTFRVVISCLAEEKPELLSTRTFVAGFGGPIVELKLTQQTADD